MTQQQIWEHLVTKFGASCGVGGIQTPGRLSWLSQGDIVTPITMTVAPQDLGGLLGDDSCFEGWACVLKAWLYDTPNLTVSLDWQRPNNVQEPGYQRFLYRAKRFAERYGNWFSVAQPAALADLRIQEGGNYLLNPPDGRPALQMPDGQFGDWTENELQEALMSPGPGESLKGVCCLATLNYKLPVCPFAGAINAANRIFPGGGAQIDLWGLGRGGDKAHIFELKKADNRHVGVISEIFFYAMVVRDLQRGLFVHPGGVGAELVQFGATNKVRADILCPRAHPVLDVQNGRVFSVLNRPSLVEGPDVQFGWIEFDPAFQFKRIW